MSMTPQQELTLLETAYSNILTGGVKSYAINGRTLTKLDMVWVAQRMDQLRACIIRSQVGSMWVAQSRPEE